MRPSVVASRKPRKCAVCPRLRLLRGWQRHVSSATGTAPSALSYRQQPAGAACTRGLCCPSQVVALLHERLNLTSFSAAPKARSVAADVYVIPRLRGSLVRQHSRYRPRTSPSRGIAQIQAPSSGESGERQSNRRRRRSDVQGLCNSPPIHSAKPAPISSLRPSTPNRRSTPDRSFTPNRSSTPYSSSTLRRPCTPRRETLYYNSEVS